VIRRLLVGMGFHEGRRDILCTVRRTYHLHPVLFDPFQLPCRPDERVAPLLRLKLSLSFNLSGTVRIIP